MKKPNNIAIIEPVSYGANEYVINGVRYTVESRFVPYDIKSKQATFHDKIKRIMNRLQNHIGRNIFTHTADCHKKGGIMNPKIQKLKDEKSKNNEKIDKLKQRNSAIDDEIEKLENIEIVGMVRAINIDISELPELLKRIKERSAASEEK